MEISKDELRRRLHIGEVESDELLELLTFFTGGCQSLDDRRLVFPNPEAGPACMILHFTVTGRVTGVEPGEALTEEYLTNLEAQIRAQLLAPPLSAVSRKILYSTQPVVGYWRFADRLVLRQLPEGNPTTPWVADCYPLILECAYPGTEDRLLSLSRGDRWADQWMSVLVLAAGHLIKPPRGPATGMWATVVRPQGETGIPTGEWVHPRYQPATWGWTGNTLCEQEDMADIAVTDDHAGPFRCESSLHLPTYLTRCLAAYNTLSTPDRQLLLRSAHWIHHAAQVRGLSASAAYIAVVQSVEVLVDAHGEPGASAPFRAFIDRYAPATTDGMRKNHRSLYKIRSQISHGSRLFVSDLELRGLPNPQRWHEEYLLDHATAACRTAIINWLLTRSAAAHTR
ncbi:hypothetical protein ACWERV_00135 [Streptomyces sp. NPDC004031]